MLCKHCGEAITMNRYGLYHVNTTLRSCADGKTSAEHVAITEVRVASLSLVKAEPYITGMIELEKEN